MLVSIALAVVTLAGAGDAPGRLRPGALGGLVLVFDAPGRQTLTYQMVGPKELQNAVALNSGLFNGSRVIGPAIAGVVIALVGTGLCFVVNAVSFLAVLVSLRLMRDGRARSRREAPGDARRRRASARGSPGRSTRPSRGSCSPWSPWSALVGFNFHVLVPLLASQTLDVGAEMFGILSAAFGLGALVGALATAILREASRRRSSSAARSASASLMLAARAGPHGRRSRSCCSSGSA